MKIDIDLNVVNMAIWVKNGRIRSRVATSFENLVKILPIGFESKKIMFDLHRVVMIFWCMLVVLVCKIIKMKNDLKNVNTM